MINGQEWPDNMTFFASTTIDADIVLNWLYYFSNVRPLENDVIKNELKHSFLVFTVIGTFAWLFIASDGFLYERLATLIADRPCTSTRDKCKGQLGACKLPTSVRKCILGCLDLRPSIDYSPGWFSLVGIVFSDIAVVVLSILVDKSANEESGLSPLAVGNMASSAYNLLVKLLETCKSLQDKRSISGIQSRAFYHQDIVTTVLPLKNNQVITASYKGESIKVWDINNQNRIATVNQRASWVAKLVGCADSNNQNCIETINTKVSWVAQHVDGDILVGLPDNPFVARFNINGTPVSIAPRIENEVCDLGPIMAAFPPQGILDTITLAALQATQTVAGTTRIRCVATYGDDHLIGGTADGKLFMWKKEEPNRQYASTRVSNEHVLFVACLNVRSAEHIITRTRDNVRRVWKVTTQDLNNQHILELTECESLKEEKVSAMAIYDDHSIIEGTTCGRVQKSDFQTSSVLRFRAHIKQVTSIAVLSDRRILTGSEDGTARLFAALSKTKK